MIRSWKKLLKYVSDNNTDGRRNKIMSLLSDDNIYFELWNDDINTFDIVIPSKDTENVILLTAHYDVVPNSFGFNDNSSGLVCLLKMIKQVPNNVEIVFTDKEELGGRGVDLYMKLTKKKIKCVINLDVVGLKGVIHADNNIYSIKECLKDCKNGKMPFNDGNVFREYKVPTLTLSMAPNCQTFGYAMRELVQTIHNNKYDNKIKLIYVSSMKTITNKVLEIISFINKK